MPSEESVIVLMAKTAIDKSAYHRALPGNAQLLRGFNHGFTLLFAQLPSFRDKKSFSTLS